MLIPCFSISFCECSVCLQGVGSLFLFFVFLKGAERREQRPALSQLPPHQDGRRGRGQREEGQRCVQTEHSERGGGVRGTCAQCQRAPNALHCTRLQTAAGIGAVALQQRRRGWGVAAPVRRRHRSRRPEARGEKGQGLRGVATTRVRTSRARRVTSLPPLRCLRVTRRLSGPLRQRRLLPLRADPLAAQFARRTEGGGGGWKKERGSKADVRASSPLVLCPFVLCVCRAASLEPFFRGGAQFFSRLQSKSKHPGVHARGRDKGKRGRGRTRGEGSARPQPIVTADLSLTSASPAAAAAALRSDRPLLSRNLRMRSFTLTPTVCSSISCGH